MSTQLRSFVARRPFFTAITAAILFFIALVLLGVVSSSLAQRYGDFITAIISYLLMSILVFMLLQIGNWWQDAGYRSPQSWLSLLFLLPFSYFIYIVLQHNLFYHTDIDIIYALAYSLLGSFAVYTFYCGFIPLVLQSRGRWIATIIAATIFGLYDVGQHVFYFYYYRGSAPNYILYVSVLFIYQAAVSFAVVAFLFRTRMLWPIILILAFSTFWIYISDSSTSITSPITSVEGVKIAVVASIAVIYGSIMVATVPKTHLPNSMSG